MQSIIKAYLQHIC